MILLFLFACQDDLVQARPPPVYFDVEVRLPDGGVAVAEDELLQFRRVSGEGCLESTWVNTSTEDVPSANVQFGWAESSVYLHGEFAAVVWDAEHARRLAGGVLALGVVSDGLLEASVDGGRICSRPHLDAEESCVQNAGTALVRLEGEFAAVLGETGTGRPGFGEDVGSGEPVCGLWDAPS